jgi:hypothetical protein
MFVGAPRPAGTSDVRHKTTPILPIALAATIAFAGCGGGSETTGSSAAFAPQASLKAVGGTKRTDKPAFVLRVKARPGDDHIRSVFVNLPPVTLVDTTSLGSFCTERDLKADGCAGKKRLGTARAVTSAYGGSLSGPVYAVTGSGQLPRLAYLLHGPPSVLLRGRIISKGGRIGAGVEDLPDVPLESFELTVAGGKDGYLVLSRNICGSKAPADAVFTSQAGATFEQAIPLEADC